MKIVVTGANGHLGVRLIKELQTRYDVCAIVRSEAAKGRLLNHRSLVDAPDLKVIVADYTVTNSLVAALGGDDVVVHLVGIIKESRQSSFQAAHEATCQAMVEAGAIAGISRIIYLSIAGTDINSRNACLASKARAESILLSSTIASTIIKVPMVLGEGDFASFALRKNASNGITFTFRAASLEQPIYAGDVIEALLSAITKKLESGSIDLAGPESLTHRDLIERAAIILGNSPRIISVPIALGMLVARLLELLPVPPVTRAMLGVLDHDDDIDVIPGCNALGIELTPLDEILGRVLVG